MKRIYVRQSKTNRMNQPKKMTIDYKEGFIKLCEEEEYHYGAVIEVEYDTYTATINVPVQSYWGHDQAMYQ